MSDIQDSRGIPRTYQRFSWSRIIDAMIGSSVANADLLTRASGLWLRKGVGSDAQLLKVVSSVPEWATSAGGGGGVGLYGLARQTTLHQVNNGTTGTTYVDTELKLTLDPGTYRFELKNFVVNHSTPDMKTRLHFTGTASEVAYNLTHIIHGNTNYFNGYSTVFDVDGVLTSSAHHTVTYRGTVVVTASGDLGWQGAQNAASAVNITIAEVGGYLTVWQLG